MRILTLLLILGIACWWLSHEANGNKENSGLSEATPTIEKVTPKEQKAVELAKADAEEPNKVAKDPAVEQGPVLSCHARIAAQYRELCNQRESSDVDACMVNARDALLNKRDYQC